VPDYYAKIHVYVCTLLIEGTPDPVLKAMACGVPVISTDFGIVADAFGEKRRSIIVTNRDVASFKAAIRRIYSDLTLLSALSSESLESIQAWRWTENVKNFDALFQAYLNAVARDRVTG